MNHPRPPPIAATPGAIARSLPVSMREQLRLELLSTVDALHWRATLSGDEFQSLKAHYDDARIFEIMLLCGFYRTVSYLANGLDLPLEENAARFPVGWRHCERSEAIQKSRR